MALGGAFRLALFMDNALHDFLVQYDARTTSFLVHGVMQYIVGLEVRALEFRRSVESFEDGPNARTDFALTLKWQMARIETVGSACFQ